MNERLKELEKQSVYYNEEDEYWDFDRKKFAELIIKECASDVFKKTGPKSALDVLAHFGVEE